MIQLLLETLFIGAFVLFTIYSYAAIKTAVKEKIHISSLYWIVPAIFFALFWFTHNYPVT